MEKDKALPTLYGMAIFLHQAIVENIPKKELKKRMNKMVDDMYAEFSEKK